MILKDILENPHQLKALLLKKVKLLLKKKMEFLNLIKLKKFKMKIMVNS
jgi:hypothetical protein